MNCYIEKPYILVFPDKCDAPAVGAGLLAKAGGVAGVLERQLPLLVPLLGVHRRDRLLARRNQILVFALACSWGTWNFSSACASEEM